MRASLAVAALITFVASSPAADPDWILHNGKIVTVDKQLSTHQAIALQGDRILRVGTNEDVLKTKGAATRLIDLQGKTVVPGLIDSHTHPSGASMIEFDHPIPEME